MLVKSSFSLFLSSQSSCNGSRSAVVLNVHESVKCDVYSHRLKEPSRSDFPAQRRSPQGSVSVKYFKASVLQRSAPSISRAAPAERPPRFPASAQKTNASRTGRENGLQSGQWSVGGATPGQRLTVESSFKGMKRICCANNKAR